MSEKGWAMTVGDDGGRRRWATTVGGDGGRRRWATTVGDNGGRQRWVTKVGDEGGRRRASNVLNTSEGQATRRMTKSLEHVKHKQGGTVGNKETNQICMRW